MLDRFELDQRIRVDDDARLLAAHGPVAAWLLGRLGMVQALANTSGGAFVRIDHALPAPLRPKYAPDHPLGRNVLLFPWECEAADDRSYAPFHRLEFTAALDLACREVIDLAAGNPDNAAWWVDVTQDLQRSSSTGLWERVYRFGIGRRKVSLLIYSTVNVGSQWSRPASEDAIRFVHEMREARGALFFDTGSRVNRVGAQPLIRVRERIIELLARARVEKILAHRWSTRPIARRLAAGSPRRLEDGVKM